MLSLVALTVLALVFLRLKDNAGTPAARARAEALPPPVPRIDLARLATERPETTAGHRDLFRFGCGRARRGRSREAARAGADAPEPVPTPPVETALRSAARTAAAQPHVSGVGREPRRREGRGADDRPQGGPHTGQMGEMVANRYRIARIGLESVDLKDVGSG